MTSARSHSTQGPAPAGLSGESSRTQEPCPPRPAAEPPFRSGLEGVIAAESELSLVDGESGELILRGFALEEVAARLSFEEMVFLMWEGRLPVSQELEDFKGRLATKRPLPRAALELLRHAVEADADAMEALRMGASTLGLNATKKDDRDLAERVLAALPTLVAAHWRLRQGLEPLEPDSSLGHAANYLYLLDGEPPTPAAARAVETYLNTVVDHGFNASTFTARVIVSTGSDWVSAVVGAIGALKGPLHGGAPGPALDTVLEIAEEERAEAVLREKLARGERLMGFGHRVYKVRDPRAEVLARAAAELYPPHDPLYRLARHVEKTAVRLLAEAKPGRRLETNVEFYTALLLHGVGLRAPLFTPTFAVGRVAGWLAHAFEQQREGRLIRPRARYRGRRDRRWTPIADR